MQILPNSVGSGRVEINKAVASNRPAEVPVDSSESVPAIKAQAAPSTLDFQASGDALESRLGAHLEYERDTQGQRGALAEYLSNQHAAKREEIQQMVGVDIYA